MTPLSENSGDDPVDSTPQLFSDSSGSSDPVLSAPGDNNIVGHGAFAPSSVGNGVVSHGATGSMHPDNDSSTSSVNVPGAVSHVASGSMRLSGADSVTVNDGSKGSGSVSAGEVVSHAAVGSVHPSPVQDVYSSNDDSDASNISVRWVVSHDASGSMHPGDPSSGSVSSVDGVHPSGNVSEVPTGSSSADSAGGAAGTVASGPINGVAGDVEGRPQASPEFPSVLSSASVEVEMAKASAARKRGHSSLSSEGDSAGAMPSHKKGTKKGVQKTGTTGLVPKSDPRRAAHSMPGTVPSVSPRARSK